MFWQVETADGQIFSEFLNPFPIDKNLKKVSWIGKDFTISIEADKPIIFKRRFLSLTDTKDIKTLYCIGFIKENKKYLLLIDDEKNEIKFQIENA